MKKLAVIALRERHIRGENDLYSEFRNCRQEALSNRPGGSAPTLCQGSSQVAPAAVFLLQSASKTRIEVLLSGLLGTYQGG